MGVYVYTLRKDTKTAVMGVQTITLARADFAFKETLSRSGYQEAALTRAANAREAIGDVTYIVIGDWETGSTVRKVSDHWYAGVDTPAFPGERVGELVKTKVGRRVYYSVRR
jgi:hypothetical protein